MTFLCGCFLILILATLSKILDINEVFLNKNMNNVKHMNKIIPKFNTNRKWHYLLCTKTVSFLKHVFCLHFAGQNGLKSDKSSRSKVKPTTYSRSSRFVSFGLSCNNYLLCFQRNIYQYVLSSIFYNEVIHSN